MTFFNSSAGTDSAFLAQLDANGSRLKYATYLESNSGLLAINGQKTVAYVPLNWIDGPALATVNFQTEPAPLFLSGSGNALSYVGAIVSPGELLSLFGVGIGPAAGVSAAVQDGMIGTTLGGVQVFFDEIAAPVLYASSSQINVQAPFEIAGRQKVQVKVQYAGGQTNGLNLAVFDAVPANFTTNGDPYGPAVVLNQDGSLNTMDNPAARGSVVIIFLIGGGVTTPSGRTGQVTPLAPLLHLSAPVTASVGPKAATVTFAGAAPELISGVNQINVRIPDEAQAGSAMPLAIAVGQMQLVLKLAIR